MCYIFNNPVLQSDVNDLIQKKGDRQNRGRVGEWSRGKEQKIAFLRVSGRVVWGSIGVEIGAVGE